MGSSARRRRLRAIAVFAVGLIVGSLGAPVTLARAEERAPDVGAPGPMPAVPPEAGVPSSDPQLDEARSIVATAETLFAAQNFAAALAEFTRAYQVLDGHPRQYFVLHNLAVCNERLFRYDLALAQYEEYLRRAPLSEPDRAEVSAVVRTLETLLGTLLVETDVPAEVWVDGRRTGSAPGRLRVATGRHVVELRAPLYEVERREVELRPRETRRLRFELRRLSTYQGPPPGYFWTAVGLSGASALVGGVFGVLALGSRQEGLERAELHLDTSEIEERTRQQALAADICFGAAAVFAGTATALYFVTDWSGAPSGVPSERKPQARRGLRVALGAGRAPGVTLDTAF